MTIFDILVTTHTVQQAALSCSVSGLYDLPLGNLALLAHCAWPRRVRAVPRAMGERVQVTASSPIVLAAMRGVGAEAQICNASAELAARDVRYKRRGGARCAIQGRQGACAMGGALIRVTEPEACEDADGLLRCRVLLVARTRVATSLRSCNEKRELCVALLFASEGRFVVRGRGSPRSSNLRFLQNVTRERSRT